ncbi:alginate export family protein [Commensalibacter melissae]|uniref:alginate export family protein n=1 Tax=Commensalibacter melissae TaxID=2070537 RepID=UPI0012D9D7F8|nr:alginate export family protein [Commensalibacter melissae]MUH05314.1 hypothetical protein [Commensalibacter melissae]
MNKSTILASLKVVNHICFSLLLLTSIHTYAKDQTKQTLLPTDSKIQNKTDSTFTDYSNLNNRCAKVVTAAGKYGNTRHPDWGVFNKHSGFGPVGNYSWYAFGQYAPYAQARWAEDWSGLCNDPHKNDDWFNRLKYIPLNDSGDIWLSLNGNERFRHVFDSKPYMGFGAKTNSNRLLIRSVYGADLHIGSHVRAYAELINGVASGSNTFGYQTGFQRKRLDMQQGFLEIKGNLLGAKMGAMGGRQYFVDAPLSMTSARELTNIRYSWDGFRGYAFWKNFRVDIFDFWQTDFSKDHVFGAGPSYNARMFGGLASYALPSFKVQNVNSQLFLDAFYIGYLYNGNAAGLPTPTPGKNRQGSTRRDNIGGRLNGNIGNFTIDVTGIYQGGEFRPANSGSKTRPVRAYAFDAIFAYNFKNVPGNLSLGLQSDYFSGGNYHKDHGAVRNFAVPYFTTANYQDMTLYLATSNTVSTGPLITYNPTKKALVKLHAPVIWRANTNDTIYGVGFNYPLRDNYSGGFVGAIPQFTLAYAIAPHLVLTGDFGGVLASQSIKKAGGNDSAFLMETLDFRF